MTRRFYIILLTIFTAFFFGCSTNDNYSQPVNSDTNETTVHSKVESEEDIDNQLDKEGIDNDNNKQPLDNLVVHYIDADQGDATLFQYDDFTIMFDTGDWKNERVINYINEVGITHINLIIISHPHADHIGQLDKIINSVSVDEVWMTENVSSSNVFQNAINAILENDIDFIEPEAGDIFNIGNMEISILHPKTLTGDLNEDSIAARFTYGDISFLFTGDAYRKQEQQMMSQNYPLQADFIQLGHHGSNTSSDPAFIQTVDPTYAIYSAGANNSYGHPHEEVVSLFNDSDMTLLGTDVHGTIKVTTDGKSYDVTTEKDGNPVSKKQDNTKKEEKLSTKPKNNANCIDINEASEAELTKIIHIGDARAKDIVNKRPYHSVDDLKKINGIGDARLNDIKDEGYACVN